MAHPDQHGYYDPDYLRAIQDEHEQELRRHHTYMENLQRSVSFGIP